jgi:superfamily I DNA and RNA helicase
MEIAGQRLQQQIRVYSDLIRQGDRLGVIVARKNDRDLVFNYLETIPTLYEKSKIIRSKENSSDYYDPSFDQDKPICILTLQGCKGLEFRAVHWLFADDLSHYHEPEHYYTVVTRAKTSLDIFYTNALPQSIARAYSQTGVAEW